MGEGIVHGLEVEPSASANQPDRPVVTVEPGLAVARSGLVLELPGREDVSLARRGAREGSEPGGLFADCQPFQPGEYVSGAGVYLLKLGPARREEGRAPVSGLANGDAPCNTAVSVEGVRFGLVRLALASSDLADEDRLRNRVAHLVFGTEELEAVPREPFGPRVERWGLLADLPERCLSADEVPLALIAWKAGEGIRWVDLWAVRRRLTHASADRDWPALVADRPRSEGEARFLQFQGEIEEALVQGVNLRRYRAREHHDWLPPVGFVPLAGEGAGRGFDEVEFFDGLTTREVTFIAGARLASLVRDSLAYPPVELGSGEMLWLYQVRENSQATQARPALVFAGGHLPYAATAQFDLSYWDFANYSLRLC